MICLVLVAARLWLGIVVLILFGMGVGTIGWVSLIQRDKDRARDDGLIGLCRLRKAKTDMNVAAVAFFAIFSAEIVTVAALVILPLN